jgi:hypothetical protein
MKKKGVAKILVIAALLIAAGAGWFEQSSVRNRFRERTAFHDGRACR